MWKVLLAKKKYEAAKRFCEDDSFKLNKIRIRQAQDLFKQVCHWSEISAKECYDCMHIESLRLSWLPHLQPSLSSELGETNLISSFSGPV